jgi:hypothetical protein
LCEFAREVREDYPLLQAVANPAVRVLLPQLRGAPPAQQLQAATALVKRWHGNALDLCGETMSADETRLVDRYRASLTADGLEPSNALAAGTGRLPVRKKRLVAEVTENLEPVLGCGRRVDGSEWEWITPVGDWLVKTAADFSPAGGRPGVCYWQWLYRADLPPFTPDVPRIDVLSLLGIYAESSWEINSEEDAVRAAGSLRRICEHFLSGVPTLVRGLSRDGTAAGRQHPS